jgi:hypothetical protein
MKLSTEELYNEFYNSLPEEYQGIPFEEVKLAVTSQYKQLKLEMENGNFEEVRLKYLGSFRVLPNRAKFMLENLKGKFKKLEIKGEVYFPLKKQLETFIKDNDESR